MNIKYISRPGLALVILTLVNACTQDKVQLSGSIENGNNRLLVLEQLDVNRTRFIDSVRVGKQGEFSFRTTIEQPELFILRNDSGRIINLLLAPGEQVRLKTKASAFDQNYVVEGSEESASIQTLVSRLDQTLKIQDSLRNVAMSIADQSSPHMNLVRTAFAQSLIDQKRFTIRYLVEHATSLTSIYALYQEYPNGARVMGDPKDLTYYQMIADSAGMHHPSSSLVLSLKTDIAQRELAEKKAHQMNTLLSMADTTHSGLIELSIPDRDGHEQRLSSLEDKVVMVFFWASWHQASVNSLLQLRSTYKKYHEQGFEVYAISMDNDKIKWMNAVDFNEFKWVNVSELTYPESEAALRYNVGSLPTNYLIDREGTIVAKNLIGRSLETWLDNLL